MGMERGCGKNIGIFARGRIRGEDEMKKYIKLILAVIPLIIGYVGFINIEGISPSWALYYAINLYGLNTGIGKINVLVEIARWTAPLVTATALLLLFKSLLDSVANRLKAMAKGSCSVYGEGEDAELFLKNLGRKGIRGNLANPLQTEYHVVFSENMEDMLRSMHPDLYKKVKRLIVQTNGYGSVNMENERMTVFSTETNAAILYWSSYPANPKEKIAIIGSGSISDALMDEAMVINILDVHQNIEYHIWDNDRSYERAHVQLDKMLEMTGDTLHTYASDWKDDILNLCEMDRIIICDRKKNNITMVLQILDVVPNIPVHVYTRYDEQLKMLVHTDRLHIFGTAEQLLSREMILKEALFEEAKKVHEHYRKEYPEMEPWDTLEGFKRKSNLSVAMYFPVLRRLQEQGKTLEELTELEHVRWCRFHYKHNWKYGEVRNNNKRIHPCLIPFEALSQEEKAKDEKNVRLALGE